MGVWFTSDLHLGNHLNGKMGEGRTRLGSTADEAGWHITETINELVHKRDKLYILGDVIDHQEIGFKWANQIRCQNVELIMGNHDVFQLNRYIGLGWKIHGFRGYKNYWLSHCPMHPYELRTGGNKIGNIHGHIHVFGDTQKIEDPR